VPDRRTPYTIADEKQTLKDFLDYLRESIVIKATGLSEDDAAKVLVGSGTNLLWLVNHMAGVEVWWFQYLFAGLNIDLEKVDRDEGETIEVAVANYRQAIALSNEIIDSNDDLDKRAARAGRSPEEMSLRWILVHMVEETARHAGHADIIREQIDGTVGR
jgi:uncharacterized damage-inducible protein DinB